MARTSKSNEVKTLRGFGTIKEYYKPTGELYSSSDYTSNVYWQLESRDTTNTPGFRSYRALKGGSSKDDLPMNPFGFTGRYRHYPYGWTIQENNTFRTERRGLLGLSFPFANEGISSSAKTSVDTAALYGILDRIKRKKIDLGVVFAERKKTSQMILDAAGRIGESLVQLKRGNFAGAARELLMVSTPRRPLQRSSPSKALANDWLALQYGWRPLISDVYNGAEELARLANRDTVLRVSSSKTHFHQLVHPVSNSWGPPMTRREFGRYTRKYVIVFSSRAQVIDDLSTLGITNPASIAWELLPWSFVIDWFVPIGKFIDALDAGIGVSFLKGCSTSFEKITSVYEARGERKEGQTTYSGNATAKTIDVEVTRTKLLSLPTPTLPRFSLDITANRGASALSLIRQRLKL